MSCNDLQRTGRRHTGIKLVFDGLGLGLKANLRRNKDEE